MAKTTSFWRSGVFIWGMTWFLTYFGVRAFVERPGTLSTVALVIIVLVPVIPFGFFLFSLITSMRKKWTSSNDGFSSRHSPLRTR